jgi:sulfate permease, SulP family
MQSIKETIKGDFFGGINAGIVALPLAMAFGVESGLGATAGLVGAIVLSIVVSIIGGMPLLISGPTGPMTVVSSLIIANELERASTPEAALTTIFVIFLLAGLLQIVLGLLKVGEYIKFVPYSIVSGFMSGIGLLMIIVQLFPLLGHPADIHILNIFKSFFSVVQNINWSAVSLGIATIVIIYLFPKITKAVPATFVALLVISIGAYFLKLDVPTIGDVSSEWMKWRWSHLITFDRTLWDDVLIPASTLALLGAVDTLLTTVVVDMFSGGNHPQNKQLIGQGIGNVLSAVTGGLPGAGATMRTMLNIRSGAKTRLSIFIHAAFLLLVLFEVGNFINYIPFAALAGILITVGINIIDYKGLRDVTRIPVSDALVMIVVLLVTIFFGLLQAFAAGIILASLSFVKKMADQNLGKAETLLLMPDEVDLSVIEPVYLSREVFIQELSGPLFFGFASHFKEALKAIPNARAVIFRMERVPFIDQSGLYALQEVLKHLKQKHIVVVFTGLAEGPKEQLRKINIIPDLVKESEIFSSFGHAADKLEQFLKDNPSNKVKKVNLNDDLEIKRLKDRLN